MFKLAIIVALVAVAAASVIPAVPVVRQIVTPVISPVIQRAIIPYGFGFGTNRFFDRYLGGPKSYGAIDGIDNLGLAYNNYDLNDGRVLGLGLGGLGYGFGR